MPAEPRTVAFTLISDSAGAWKSWEIIADNLSKAGWSWGVITSMDSEGRDIVVVDAHRDGKRFVVLKSWLRFWSWKWRFAPPPGKRTRAGNNEYFSTVKVFLSIILAVAVSISTAMAKHGGHRGHGGYHGKHGKHFSSKSPRGGRNFSRSGWKFSRGKSGKYRNWGGRNWSGDRWSGGYWSGGSRFIFIGGGYPYYWNWYPYWGWRYPYSYYSYYPSYWYAYDSCSVSRQRFFGP